MHKFTISPLALAISVSVGLSACSQADTPQQNPSQDTSNVETSSPEAAPRDTPSQGITWDEASAVSEFEACYKKTSLNNLVETCAYIPKCIDGTEKNSTSLGMSRCAAKGYELWDAKLNMEYKTLLPILSNTGGDTVKSAFIKSQRAWIDIRDTECDYEYKKSSYTGALAASIKNSCLSDLTAKRTQEFKSDIQEFVAKGYELTTE